MSSPWDCSPVTQELLALGALTSDIRPPFLSRTIKNTINSEKQKRGVYSNWPHSRFGDLYCNPFSGSWHEV